MILRQVIGNCDLWCGDCREVLEGMISEVDVVITDPPYGVGLGQSKRSKRGSYHSFEDTPEMVAEVCVPAIEKCLKKYDRLVMTPGNKCMFMYPQPDDVGIWYNPASTNRGKWGFSHCNGFIYYYGKDPLNIGAGARPNSVTKHCESVADIDHPCPKPLSFMKWLVGRASHEGETVLDPFMGAGTTLVACTQMGRSGIGIEIDERYFDIACRRVEEAYKQRDLFLNRQDVHAEEQLNIF